jgi:hypothetical protein
LVKEDLVKYIRLNEKGGGKNIVEIKKMRI